MVAIERVRAWGLGTGEIESVPARAAQTVPL
jgi:hypothetical protein